jgi:hypothetical protein
VKTFLDFSKDELQIAADVCEAFANHALDLFKTNVSEYGITDKRTLNAHDHCHHAGCTSETIRKLIPKLFPEVDP